MAMEQAWRVTSRSFATATVPPQADALCRAAVMRRWLPLGEAIQIGHLAGVTGNHHYQNQEGPAPRSVEAPALHFYTPAKSNTGVSRTLDGGLSSHTVL
jgi:hypothetical protein